MDTTHTPTFHPDDASRATSADEASPDDALVPELLATLEAVDPAEAPVVAERLATLLSDDLET